MPGYISRALTLRRATAASVAPSASSFLHHSIRRLSAQTGLYGIPLLKTAKGFRRFVDEAIEKSSDLVSNISQLPPSDEVIKAMDEISDTVCAVVDSAELCRNTHPDREYVDEASNASMRINEYLHALLSGCSAGGLAAIQHCHQFRALFPGSMKVKCLADAGLFLDVMCLRAYHHLALLTWMQHRASTLKMSWELFSLNTAYDVWQLRENLAPSKVDLSGYWKGCKFNHSKCDATQINILQGFRNAILTVAKNFSLSEQNGLFINPCFAHCQSERQDTRELRSLLVIGSSIVTFENPSTVHTPVVTIS